MKKLKLRKSCKKDVGLTSKQFNYLAHEIAKGNIELVSGEFNHKTFWFLHACAHHYCKQTWLTSLIEKGEIPLLDERDIKTITEFQKRVREVDTALMKIEKDDLIRFHHKHRHKEYTLEELVYFYPFIIIRESEIKNYLGRKWDIEDMVKTAKAIPGLTFYGEANLFPTKKENWLPLSLKGGVDNLCGLFIAHEEKEYNPLRSTDKLRGHGHKREEIVFILNFRSRLGGIPWGQVFLLSLLKARVDTVPSEIYSKLPPNTQSLYFSLIWNNWSVEYDVEAMSFLLEKKWPALNIPRRIQQIDEDLKKIFDTLDTIKFKKDFLKRPKKIEGRQLKDTKWLFLKKETKDETV